MSSTYGKTHHQTFKLQRQSGPAVRTRHNSTTDGDRGRGRQAKQRRPFIARRRTKQRRGDKTIETVFCFSQSTAVIVLPKSPMSRLRLVESLTFLSRQARHKAAKTTKIIVTSRALDIQPAVLLSSGLDEKGAPQDHGKARRAWRGLSVPEPLVLDLAYLCSLRILQVVILIICLRLASLLVGCIAYRIMVDACALRAQQG